MDNVDNVDNVDKRKLFYNCRIKRSQLSRKNACKLPLSKKIVYFCRKSCGKRIHNHNRKESVDKVVDNVDNLVL